MLLTVPPVHEVINIIAFGIANSIGCISGPWMLKDPLPLRLIPVNGRMNLFAGQMAPPRIQLVSVGGSVELAENLIGTNILNGLVWGLGPMMVVTNWSSSFFLYGRSAFNTLPRTAAPV